MINDDDSVKIHCIFKFSRNCVNTIKNGFKKTDTWKNNYFYYIPFQFILVDKKFLSVCKYREAEFDIKTSVWINNIEGNTR